MNIIVLQKYKMKQKEMKISLFVFNFHKKFNRIFAFFNFQLYAKVAYYQCYNMKTLITF